MLASSPGSNGKAGGSVKVGSRLLTQSLPMTHLRAILAS
jgi:hypothetical protein